MSSSTDSEGSATISKSWRPGPVETSLRGGANSIPAGVSLRTLGVARVEPDADEPVGDDEVLDAPVRRERRPQPFGVEPGHEEVRVLRVEPEQLVAHGAADEVRVEPEPADVLLDLLAHPAILAGPAERAYSSAIASISTSAPEGSFATSTVARAGGCSPTCFA